MAKAIKFKQAAVPKQQGEVARVKVINGPDYGSLFVIAASKVTLGRGDENDIVISDLKASRTHAEILYLASGWQIKDKGSANGIVVAGKSVRELALKTGATFTLGETTLEFVAAEAGTAMLVAPPKTPAQYQSEQAAFAARQAAVKSMGKTQQASIFVAGAAGANGGLFKNKRVLAILAGLGIVFFMMDDLDGKKKTVRKAPEKKRNIAAFLPDTEDASGVTSKAADVFFRAGFREFREKNYLRAKIQFETVLQMVPGHRLATIYLENSNKAIEDEVRFHMEKGKKGLKSGKLKDAKGHYEAILRLLYRDQSSPSYIEARDQLKVVTQEMLGEGKKPKNPGADQNNESAGGEG